MATFRILVSTTLRSVPTALSLSCNGHATEEHTSRLRRVITPGVRRADALPCRCSGAVRRRGGVSTITRGERQRASGETKGARGLLFCRAFAVGHRRLASEPHANQWVAEGKAKWRERTAPQMGDARSGIWVVGSR